MDRRKSLLQARLVVPLVIVGSAFVFCAMFIDNRPGDAASLGSTSIMDASSRSIESESNKMRIYTAPSMPRLLPHSTACQYLSVPETPKPETQATSSIVDVRSVDNPLIQKSVDLPLILKMVEEAVEEEKVAEQQVVEEPVAVQPTAELPELELPSPPPIDVGADEHLARRDTRPTAPVVQPPAPPRQYPATVEQPSEAKAPEARPKAAGPQYSWLLEGQADVPTGTHHRSRELERIAQEADSHTRRGFDLAGRRAYYSARSEFIKALRLVAQGLDVEHQTSVHSRALRAGLTALDEADDFVPSGPQLKSEMNLQAIIEGHDTPVLKLSRPHTLTAIEALRRYYGFAQYQLAVAAGREVAGSMALHALAKLYASSENNPTLTIVSAKSKAMTCFQAALVAYPRNYMASNDLGVLLANSGRFDDARMILEESAANTPHSTTWHNLAVVYHELRMNNLAARAEANYRASLEQEMAQRNARSPGTSDPRVVWLSPDDFAKTYAQTADARQPMPARPGAAMSEARNHTQAPVQVAEKPSPADSEKKSSGWPWNIFKRRPNATR